MPESVNADPNPYQQNFKVYSITRPAELAAFGESYEVEAEEAQLSATVDHTSDTTTDAVVDTGAKETLKLERQGSTGFDIVNPNTGEMTSAQIATPQTPAQTTGSKDIEDGGKGAPDQYFVEYDPDGISVKDLADMGAWTFNVLCQNQKAWFRVDRNKAIRHGIAESKILIVKDIDELVDMSPYRRMSIDWGTEGFTEEAIQAYNHEVCMTSTDVLRHVSFQLGHASLRVKINGFELNTWLKSLRPNDLWHQSSPKKPDFMPEPPVLSKTATEAERLAHSQLLRLYEEYEAKLARYEAREQWYESFRASRSRASLMLMFWPDWFEHILTEEHPLFVETGTWGERYQLMVKRRGVEMINLHAQISPTGIWQDVRHTTYEDSLPGEERDAVGMRPALVLPFHVLSGEVETVNNHYTYTPLARPRCEPGNRALTMHVYHTHYRPELEKSDGISWSDIPTIPAIVYDFYSKEDDSQIHPVNRQPRIT